MNRATEIPEITISEIPRGTMRSNPNQLPSVPQAVATLGLITTELLPHASEALQPHITERFNESLTVLLEAYERLALAHHYILALARSGSDPIGSLLNIAEESRQALLLPFLDPAIIAHLEEIRPAPSKPVRRTMRYVDGRHGSI